MEMILKNMTLAMLLSGVLLVSTSAAAESLFTAGSKVVGYTSLTPDRDDSPYPVEGTPVSYGVQAARTDSESPFPDQSDSNDYGIRIASEEVDSTFPDQSKSNDYAVRVAV